MDDTVIKKGHDSGEVDHIQKALPRLRKNEDSDKDEKAGLKHAPPRKPNLFSIWYFLIFFAVLYAFNSFMGEKPRTVEFSEFKQKIVSGEIKRVELGDEYYVGMPSSSGDLENPTSTSEPLAPDGTQSPVYRTIPVNDPGFVPLLDSKGVEYYTRPVSFTQVLGNFFLSWILPLGIMLAFWWFLSSRMKGGGMGGVMSFGKNKAQLVSEGDTGVGFADVAGADESKEELMEVVDFL
ncbi:MAG: hypothetical protein GY866_26030, partial [Proteobacteria bacterium]|nr:hypothetical protein [Pseudomonadota bacterium]